MRRIPVPQKVEGTPAPEPGLTPQQIIARDLGVYADGASSVGGSTPKERFLNIEEILEREVQWANSIITGQQFSDPYSSLRARADSWFDRTQNQEKTISLTDAQGNLRVKANVYLPLNTRNATDGGMGRIKNGEFDSDFLYVANLMVDNGYTNAIINFGQEADLGFASDGPSGYPGCQFADAAWSWCPNPPTTFTQTSSDFDYLVDLFNSVPGHTFRYAYILGPHGDRFRLWDGTEIARLGFPSKADFYGCNDYDRTEFTETEFRTKWGYTKSIAEDFGRLRIMNEFGLWELNNAGGNGDRPEWLEWLHDHFTQSIIDSNYTELPNMYFWGNPGDRSALQNFPNGLARFKELWAL